jgi:Xaa-Pro aminopeptidase
LAVKNTQNSIAQSENDTAAHNSAKPETIVLAPKFESSRARQLPVRASQLTFVEWEEEENPYHTLLAALGLETDDSDSDADTMTKSKRATIFVDPMIRKFIADGIQEAAPSTLDLKVVSAPKEIRLLRERKEPEEIEILRCANEVGCASSLPDY